MAVPRELAVLMQLGDFGWDSGRKPYPWKKARGQRLGLWRRTNASGKVTWRHPESTKSIVAPVADQHVS